MAIIKKKLKVRNFTTIENNILQNEEMSYEAKGLLTELLSRPEDWAIRKTQLIRSHTGISKLSRIFKELKKAGHLYIHSERGIIKGGRNVIVDRIWVVSEYPMTKQEYVDFLKVGKPYVKKTLIKENPQLQIKSSLQKKDNLLNLPANGETKMNRDKQEIIAKRIALLTSKPEEECYGIAGRFINAYGDDLTITVLEGLQEGSTIAYMTGALKKEFCLANPVVPDEVKELSEAWK